MCSRVTHWRVDRPKNPSTRNTNYLHVSWRWKRARFFSQFQLDYLQWPIESCFALGFVSFEGGMHNVKWIWDAEEVHLIIFVHCDQVISFGCISRSPETHVNNSSPRASGALGPEFNNRGFARHTNSLETPPVFDPVMQSRAALFGGHHCQSVSQSVEIKSKSTAIVHKEVAERERPIEGRLANVSYDLRLLFMWTRQMLDNYNGNQPYNHLVSGGKKWTTPNIHNQRMEILLFD